MAFAYRIAGEWSEIVGPFAVGDLRYPASWPELASPEELTAVGVYLIEEAGERPAGVEVLGIILTGDTTPRREWVTQPYTVDEARALRLQELATVANVKINGGVTIAGVGLVRTGLEDRIQILTAFVVAETMLEAGEAFSVPVDLADGTSVTLDAAQTVGLGLAIAGAQGAILGRARTLKAAIIAASDPTTIDIDSGW